MNWKDVPNLFANGRFRVLCEIGEYKSIGIFNGIYLNKIINSRDEYSSYINHNIENCTLIAREIPDMNTEERNELRKTFYDNNIWTPKSLLYCLSIGVYPFDQIHFEDGTVIDSKTL